MRGWRNSAPRRRPRRRRRRQAHWPGRRVHPPGPGRRLPPVPRPTPTGRKDHSCPTRSGRRRGR
ncbi:MAG: hypothetical protein FJZ96_05820 [Chloroflexi bacterium]|nr:hypothetical protein [Chloroflexota bacterium]